MTESISKLRLGGSLPVYLAPGEFLGDILSEKITEAIDAAVLSARTVLGDDVGLSIDIGFEVYK